MSMLEQLCFGLHLNASSVRSEQMSEVTSQLYTVNPLTEKLSWLLVVQVCGMARHQEYIKQC